MGKSIMPKYKIGTTVCFVDWSGTYEIPEDVLDSTIWEDKKVQSVAPGMESVYASIPKNVPENEGFFTWLKKKRQENGW